MAGGPARAQEEETSAGAACAMAAGRAAGQKKSETQYAKRERGA